MKNKKMNYFIYIIVNLIFILTSMSFVVIMYKRYENMKFSYQFFFLIIIFVIIHILKMLRQYLILMEEKIPIKEFIKIYIKTTFVSIILPFKSGEIFKIYSYGSKMKNYKKGILAVLIDKFFDAILLVSLMVIYSIGYNEELSLVAILLLVFSISIFIIYFTFNSTYYYLNKFLILNKPNNKSLYLLNFIEKLKIGFDWMKEMIRNRAFLLAILTIFAWVSEYFFIKVFASITKIKFVFSDFVSYINAAFYGLNNLILNSYIFISGIVLMSIILIIYGLKYLKGGKR